MSEPEKSGAVCQGCRASFCSVFGWICSNAAACSLFKSGSNSAFMRRPLLTSCSDTALREWFVQLIAATSTDPNHWCQRLAFL